jgi:hypothetical protein
MQRSGAGGTFDGEVSSGRTPALHWCGGHSALEKYHCTVHGFGKVLFTNSLSTLGDIRRAAVRHRYSAISKAGRTRRQN